MTTEMFLWFLIYWFSNFAIILAIGTRETLGSLHPVAWIIIFLVSPVLFPIAVIIGIATALKKK